MTQLPTINIVSLYHHADSQDWQRLQQHLDVTHRQVTRKQECDIAITTFECNPKDEGYIGLIANATQMLSTADIIILGMSVDMMQILQYEQYLYTTFLTRMRQMWERRGLEGPYTMCVRMKVVLLDALELYGAEIIPEYYNRTLTGSKRDEYCADIAGRVQIWLEDIINERKERI